MAKAARIFTTAVLSLLAPVSLFVLGRVFPVTQETTILFQPPSWVVGVVWFILSSSLLLVGAVTWLLFASAMNGVEVQAYLKSS